MTNPLHTEDSAPEMFHEDVANTGPHSAWFDPNYSCARRERDLALLANLLQGRLAECLAELDEIRAVNRAQAPASPMPQPHHEKE